jgi:hypothetical protein
MSYLDLPRLHFSGLFYTGPSTINNILQNYTPTVTLETNNEFAPRALWNPNGVAQWWLEECKVLSAVGPTGVAVSSSAQDIVVGASVESPSPSTPMSDGKDGFYDIAKMVDLDPDQQGRSALHGVRISVTLPNGAGLQGLLTVPELRQLNARIPAGGGSWAAVGNWMGNLNDVEWTGDISGSPILTALKAAATQGLAVKLTADLHQNNAANVFTAGDLFCYGRVLGSIGPVLSGDLAQVVPGRYLASFSGPAADAAAAALDAAAAPADQGVVQGRERAVAKAAAIGAKRAAAAATVAADDAVTADVTSGPWNPAFAVIRQSGSQNLLSIDIGGSILLEVTGTQDDPKASGKFEINTGITLGLFNLASQQFTAFASGALSFLSPDQYEPLVSSNKTCQLVRNSGVFTIPLTAAEATTSQSNPLAIQVNGVTVAQEYNSGLWMDVSVSSERLECGSGQTAPAQIMVRKFGAPQPSEAPPVTTTVQLVQWTKNGVWKNALVASTDVGITIGNTDSNGLANITTNVLVTNISVPVIREPLGSQIYYISLNDPDGNIIGDGAATLSILLWETFQAPTDPSWNDIGPIFSAYARLYPGMKARLDLSNEQTVVGFAPSFLEHMSVPILDPAYMPVTRDLSPTKMAMIVAYLESLVAQSSGS